MGREKVINFMQMNFLSVPENVGLARVAIAAFVSRLDLTVSDLEEIKVATSEAVSNAIIHGYEQQRDKQVHLEATLYEQELNIVIQDEGKGIEDVDQAMQPAFSTDPERMGLGFVFIKSFVDDVRVQSAVGKGTRVELHRTFAKQSRVAVQEN